MSERTRVVVGVGSNIDPEHHVPAAVRRLADVGEVLAVSDFYRSKPADGSDQADYVNGAVLLATGVAEDGLKPLLRRIEDDLGRVRDPSDKNAPRTIDLDVAAYGEAGEPDPDVLTRWFVAVPLADVWPDWTCPRTGETAAAIAARLRSQTDETIEVVRFDATERP